MRYFFKYAIFGAAFLFILLGQVSGQDQSPRIEVQQKQFQIPVLTNQPGNPVLRLRITVAGAAPLPFNGIQLTATGSSRLADLEKLSIYYTGKDSSSKQLPDGELIGSAAVNGSEVQVKGHIQLDPGTHFFWVSLDMNPAASLDHLVSITARELTAGGETIAVQSVTKPLKQRLGVAVRGHGQDGVHTSRIPGLATTNKGTLLAIFDARYDSARDLQGDIDIGLHRSTDGGTTWEPIQIVLDQKEWGGLPEKFNGVSDACILVDRNSNTIYIAGLWMHGVLTKEGHWLENLDENSDAWNHQWRNKGSQPGYGTRQTSQFLIVKSTDDGKTWGQPRNVTRMCKKAAWWLLAPAPGRGITMDDGTLVFPSQGRDASGEGFSTITYSKDGGETWITGSPASMAVDASTSECAVAQLSDGSLMLNMRSGKNKENAGSDNGRPVAISTDMGETWREHPTSFGALPEPTCMASLYKYAFDAKGEKHPVLVFSNPNSKQHRENMTVKVSTDDGDTWPVENQVLLDEWRGRGYSCLTSAGNDHIGILYESSQADLVFQRINLNTILNQ